MSFINKVVIITGGSSGIGAATAVIFAKEGANVVIAGRNEANLKAVAEKCGQVGKPALVIKADITKDNCATEIIKKTIERYLKLDILVNNAGVFRYSSFMDSNYVETYDTVVNVNVRSMAVLSHLAVPYLVETKGNIVNVSSVMASMQLSGYTAYTSSKAAVNQFTKTAANELAEKGVRVNAVSPGPVQTHLFEEAGKELTWEFLRTLTALDKIAKPEEVGELIAYLASDKASSVTGSNFVIDCGTVIKQ